MTAYIKLTVRELAAEVQAELDRGRYFVNKPLGESCAQMIKRLVNGTNVARRGRKSGPRGEYTDEEVALIDAYAERYLRTKDL